MVLCNRVVILFRIDQGLWDFDIYSGIGSCTGQGFLTVVVVARFHPITPLLPVRHLEQQGVTPILKGQAPVV